MITRREYLMGRDALYPLSQELEANLLNLLGRLNMLRTFYGRPMIVTSGYRPKKINDSVGGKPKSKHITCQACDFDDRNGVLSAFCLSNLEILERCELWMEDPTYTLGWVHLQSVAPKSGKRVFKP